jgi:hypothetical protein
MVNAACVVVTLPKLYRSCIRCYKNCTSYGKIQKINVKEEILLNINVTSPKKGLSGVDRMALMAVWRKSIAECGTENGCAKAWNAEPHVICQGAIYVTTN